MADIYILAPDNNGACCDCTSRLNPCDSCAPSTGCACTLFIAGDPFANSYRLQAEAISNPSTGIAAAQSLITNYTAGCIAFFPGNIGGGGIIAAKGASFNPTTRVATITETVTHNNASDVGVASFIDCSLAAGGIPSVHYNVSVAGGGIIQQVIVSILNCSANTLIQQVSRNIADFGISSSQVGTITLDPVALQGEYVIAFNAIAGPGSTSGPPDFIPNPFGDMDSTFAVSSSSAFSVNPIVALYKVGTETKQLEACTFLKIPFLNYVVPNHGNKFADLTTAQNVLASVNVSNCVGYAQGFPGSTGAGISLSTITSFTATAGTSLTLAGAAHSNLGQAVFTMAGAVVLLVGSILSVAYTNNDPPPGGFGATEVTLYDADGNFIEDRGVSGSDPASGTFTFNITATGKYHVVVQFQGKFDDQTQPENSSGQITISSNNTMKIGTIEALYEMSNDCPGILYCS